MTLEWLHSLNADCDATKLDDIAEEAQEGRNAFLDNRPPDFFRFPCRP